MFRAGRYKKLLIVSIILVSIVGTTVLAAGNIYDKKLTATHGRIKFKVDGKDVTKDIEEKYGTPAFVVKEYGERSYVPVRAIAELMGLEIEYDEKTHTAEIIDAKSKAYEEEIRKRDEEIAELKKEIEKLKGESQEEPKDDVKETSSLKELEKKLNNRYSTYKNLYFDITLKEDKNMIDVEIVMDLKDSKQERYWLNMGKANKEAMVKDIVDTISKEYKDKAIHGSIYDLFYKKNFLTFSKPRIGKLTIFHDERLGRVYDSYIDDVVYDEFNYNKIRGAYIENLRESSYQISFDIILPRGYYKEWRDIEDDIEDILDTIAYDVLDYYGYHSDKDISINIYMDNDYLGNYFKGHNSRYGRFK